MRTFISFVLLLLPVVIIARACVSTVDVPSSKTTTTGDGVGGGSSVSEAGRG